MSPQETGGRFTMRRPFRSNQWAIFDNHNGEWVTHTCIFERTGKILERLTLASVGPTSQDSRSAAYKINGEIAQEEQGDRKDSSQ